jgi:hypothetical protein
VLKCVVRMINILQEYELVYKVQYSYYYYYHHHHHHHSSRTNKSNKTLLPIQLLLLVLLLPLLLLLPLILPLVVVFIVTFDLFENRLVLLLSVRSRLQHAKVSWLCVDDLHLTYTVIVCMCMYLCIMSVNTRALSINPIYWFGLLFISPRTYRHLYSFMLLRLV